MTLYRRLVLLIARAWSHLRGTNFRLAIAPVSELRENNVSALGQLAGFDAAGVRRRTIAGVKPPPALDENAPPPMNPVHTREAAQELVKKANAAYAKVVTEQLGEGNVPEWRPFRLERGAP